MVKASDVIGRRITARGGGNEMGRIRDLVVDPSGREVIGIVLSDGLITGSRVALWSAVQAFGPDSVVIEGAASVVKARRAPEIKAVLDTKKHIRGLRLLTTSGKELGKISDFQFDEQTGEVDGYELSGGLLSDTMEGNPFLPTPKWIELGKDVAFIAPEVEATIRSNTGGIKGAFRRGSSTGSGGGPSGGPDGGAADGGAADGVPGGDPGSTPGSTQSSPA